MNIRRFFAATTTAVLLATPFSAETSVAQGHHGDHPRPHAHTLVSGLEGGAFGSTIGPGGDLFVTEPVTGEIARIDRHTGETTTYASGLPVHPAGLGGVNDVTFRHGTAYALVGFVSPDVGGSDIDGIYRIDGPSDFTIIADIGAFATAHPPATDFEAPTGVQFAIENFRDGFIVSDGHHNRIYRVTLDGRISVLRAFPNVVPTGMDVHRHAVFLAEAGPVPHRAKDGVVVRFGRNHGVERVASGARLLTDVEVGAGGLFAVSQGVFPGGSAGTPAAHDTGSLVRGQHGHFVNVVRGLDQPVSVSIVGHTAYVTTLGGDVIEIDHITGCRH